MENKVILFLSSSYVNQFITKTGKKNENFVNSFNFFYYSDNQERKLIVA